MLMSWLKRTARLGALLNTQGNDEEDGLALDRLLHGQSVIGQTSRTKEVDSVRFSDRDLSVIGTLERGQYGVIHLVTCKLDGRVYVRKSIEKKFALRTRDQCSPVVERTILLRALQTRTPWCPHLFCAFQNATHLNLMMDYATGGSLQDLLESSVLEGRVCEADLRWWAPQIVSAVAWCHEQGFAHRDIKPNNLVLTESAHLLLIDFGSAAPLLPADTDGRRALARENCLVPCGTCDYISPEILIAHERALVRLEMEMDDDDNEFARSRSRSAQGVDDDEEAREEGYGAETDWWSCGVMLYEMAYGVTPFFAESIKTTYLRIMDHETSLRFDKSIAVSEPLKDLIRCLLSDASRRLGRQGVQDIIIHPFFSSTDWDNLHEQPAPPNLHVPQFAYDVPVPEDQSAPIEEDESQNLGWSALFQSSAASPAASHGLGSLVYNTPGLKSIMRTPSGLRTSPAASDMSTGMSSFIGFSWGPRRDINLAPHAPDADRLKVDISHTLDESLTTTPRPFSRVAPIHATPIPFRATPGFGTARKQQRLVTPMRPGQHPYLTPARPLAHTPGGAITGSTMKRRAVTEREAMRQMIDCVGMSARKAVLASGRKPRVLAAELFQGPSAGRSGARREGTGRSRSVSVSTLSFTESLTQSAPRTRRPSASGSVRKELRFVDAPVLMVDTGLSHAYAQEASAATSRSSLGYIDPPLAGAETATDTDTDTASVPASPSPSPRPGSAMSLSRRSLTPTATLSGFGFGSSLSLRPGTALGFVEDRTPRMEPVSPVLDEFSAATVGREGGRSKRPPNDAWDDLDNRHAQLIKDLDALQLRLDRIRCR